MITQRMGRKEYDAIDAINFSTMKWLDHSPAHYRAALQKEWKDTDDLLLGRITHIAVYEPERWKAAVAVWDGGARDLRHRSFAEFVEAHRGLEICTTKQADQAQAIAHSARAAAGDLLRKGKAELTLQWVAKHGLKAKGRIDFLSSVGEGVIDFKSTKDARPVHFGKSAANLAYHAQAAWYVDALDAIEGKREKYVIVASEKTYPHITAVFDVPESQLRAGRKLYEAWVDKIRVCRDENHWPAYDRCELELPAWALDEQSKAGYFIPEEA
jgi:hypothetical protein